MFFLGAYLIRMTPPDILQSILAGYGGDPKGRSKGRLCVRLLIGDHQMMTPLMCDIVINS